MSQRRWDDVVEGEALAPVAFPLTIYRLVMAAGSNRDFNAIHHNSDYARATGAPDMYANTLFLQGMWERCVRDYIGPAGTIRTLSGFRMRRFNPVGTTPVVTAHVVRKWVQGGAGLAEIALQTAIGETVTVGPGAMTVTLPLGG
jgi:acyl dehydratase